MSYSNWIGRPPLGSKSIVTRNKFSFFWEREEVIFEVLRSKSLSHAIFALQAMKSVKRVVKPI